MESGSDVDKDVTIGSGSNAEYQYPFANGRPDDPENKEQSAGACIQYFPMITKNVPEFADYELVEPMNFTFILANGSAHMNFKAKHKDADDSSIAVYFAELVLWDDKVTFLKKLDVLPPDHIKICGFCHYNRGGEWSDVAGGGYVYHPAEGGFKFGLSQSC